MTSGISNELWTAANIRGSIGCESHGIVIHISLHISLCILLGGESVIL